MGRFAPILPELLLAIGATVLMVAAAFAGRKGSGLINGLAVALLLAATAALIGAPSHAGPVFDGLVSADLFASFGKALIFPAAAVAIIAAQGWFERGAEHASEYAVLILFSAVGMSVMVSATSLISLYVGLELQSLAAYVLASYRRSDERSAEAGLKYFVLGALASGILLYGISLLYGFTGTTSFTGIAAAFGRGAPSLGLLFGLVFVLAGLAFKASAVPFHMWTPDVYEGAPTPVTAFFASAPKAAAVLLATRVCLDALGPALDAWRQIMIFAALASIFLGAIAAFGQTNIKRLLAYSSINNVGFILIGLAGAGVAGASSVLFYMAVYIPMTLGAFLCVLWMRDAEGRPVEDIYSLSGLSQTRPAFAAAIAIFMFSLAGIPPFFGFWAKLVVFNAAVQAGLVPLAVAGILGTVVGAYYYLKIVKVMYMDEPGAPYGRVKQPLQGLLIALAAIAVSPLGYLLIGPLGALADRAAEFDLLSRIRIVERTGSTNADILADESAVEGDWLVALAQDAGRGRQGRQWVSTSGNFFGSTVVQLRRGDPQPQTLSLTASLALAEAVDVAVPAQTLMLKWPNDVMLLGGKLGGILLERSGDRVAIGFGLNLASAPALPDRQAATLLANMTPRAFVPLLAASFARRLEIWRQEATAELARAWLARAHLPGTWLSVHVGQDAAISGRFAGLEHDGALRLMLDDGTIEVVRAGDVRL